MSVQILKKVLPSLKEIRIHLCPKATTSDGVRQFVNKYYLGIKQNNPNLPILVRECTGIEPRVWFRFEYGNETSSSLINLNGDQIAKLLEEKVALKERK